MEYVNYITAMRFGDQWRADAHFAGPDAKMRDQAYAWAASSVDGAGHAQETCVIRFDDAREASAVFSAKFMTLREAEMLGADVLPRAG